MHALIQKAELVTAQVHILAAGIPDPKPTAPPGSDGLITILNWVSWIALFLCFVCFVWGAGKLAMAANNGNDTVAIKSLALPIIGVILCGAVGGIMRIFL